MTKSTEQLVEEQVRRWHFERQMRDQSNRYAYKAEPPPPRCSIAISNQFGSGAIPVGRRIGELLGVPVFEREILAHIATTRHVRIETLETLDEHTLNRIEDYIELLFRERSFDQSDYHRALVDTVVSLWAHGPCVMIGHGCAHIVPREYALTVRFTAPFAVRVAQVQALEGLSESMARRRVEHVDSERAGFVRHSFGVGIADPLAYDMVVNSDRFDVDSCAAIVIRAYERRVAATTAAAVTAATLASEQRPSPSNAPS